MSTRNEFVILKVEFALGILKVLQLLQFCVLAKNGNKIDFCLIVFLWPVGMGYLLQWTVCSLCQRSSPVMQSSTPAATFPTAGSCHVTPWWRETDLTKFGATAGLATGKTAFDTFLLAARCECQAIMCDCDFPQSLRPYICVSEVRSCPCLCRTAFHSFLHCVLLCPRLIWSSKWQIFIIL